MEITPVLKDTVLKLLIDNYDTMAYHQIDMPYLFKEAAIDFDTFHAIMYLFENDGLVEELNLRRDASWFSLRPQACELSAAGGYNEIERFKRLEQLSLILNVEVLEAELQKLYSEIENIKKSNPTFAERLLSIAANIVTIIGITALKNK